MIIMPISLNSKNNRGFTLIEVMVAAVILFSVIATVSMIYRGAFLSSEKANNHINISAVLPSVLTNIRQNIRLKGNSSAEILNNRASAWDVKYQWQAQLIKKASAPAKLDPDSGAMITPPEKYKLWQVELIMKRNGVTKQYQFNELSWTNE
jgi:prepilin-type N-terminal cleavage/methylation domain-containing protein